MAGRLVNSPCLINFASWNILLSLYISLSTSVLSWSADCYFCFLEQYDDSTRFREVLGDLFFYSLPDCWLTLVWKRKFLRLIISTQMLSDVYCHQRSAEMIANSQVVINPLNPELNPICYLLALLGAHHFLHVSRIRVKLLTFRRLMSYIHIQGDVTLRRNTFY